MFPIDRYHFYYFDDKQGRKHIVAASTYAGKTVRGEAICSTDDAYSVELGKTLAAARCDLKVAEKRAKNANKVYNEACYEADIAYMVKHKASIYKSDSEKEVKESKKRLQQILKTTK